MKMEMNVYFVYKSSLFKLCRLVIIEKLLSYYFLLNKHCEVLVSCSDKELDNFMELHGSMNQKKFEQFQKKSIRVIKDTLVFRWK